MQLTRCKTVNFTIQNSATYIKLDFKRYKMKNFRTIIVTLILIVSTQLNAQLVWEISSKKAAHKSYLIGTHPLIPAIAFDSLIQVYKIFNKSDVILSTYDNYTIDSEALLKSKALLPLNKTAKNFLSDTVYAEVDIELRRVLKLTLAELGRLHPLIIREMYLTELFAQSINLKDDIQSDSYFQRVASTKGQKVVGIENYEVYLTQLLDASEVKFHAERLAQDVLNGKSYKNTFETFYRTYCNNDLKGISKLVTEHPYLTTNLKAKNKTSMLPKNLVSLLKTNRCFYVTDVTSLVGENTILDLLKIEGFEVKPL